MNIRRLLASDSDRFQALRLQALRDSPGAFSSSYEEECDTSPAAVAQFLTDRIMLGAFVGVDLVGMIGVGREAMRKTRHKGFIRAMYVAPGQRGAGLAKRLVTEALAVLEAMDGVRQVTLAVTSGNAAAMALYVSLGFTPFGREPDSLLIDGVMYEDTHMVRHFAGGA
jgi:ribosomal protein S18 acetylase RimI-like enzyme